jgi:hypothetical membrane protein
LGKLLKAAGVLGLVTPVFVFICIFVAILSWTGFSWTGNALSDLGVQWGLTANLFNSGLVVGGILFMFFAVGLFTFLGKRWVGKIGVCLFFLACVALVGIGVFNETFSPTHYIVSVMLFVFMPLSMLAFVGAIWLDSQRKLSLFTLALSLIAAAVWVLQFTIPYVSGVAVPEAVSGLAGSAWAIILGYLMVKEARQEGSS